MEAKAAVYHGDQPGSARSCIGTSAARRRQQGGGDLGIFQPSSITSIADGVWSRDAVSDGTGRGGGNLGLSIPR